MSNTVEGREAQHVQGAPSAIAERAACLNAPRVLNTSRADLRVFLARFLRPAVASVYRDGEGAGQLKMDAAWLPGNFMGSGEQDQGCP